MTSSEHQSENFLEKKLTLFKMSLRRQDIQPEKYGRHLEQMGRGGRISLANQMNAWKPRVYIAQRAADPKNQKS